jgi:hypothetical protein
MEKRNVSPEQMAHSAYDYEQPRSNPLLGIEIERITSMIEGMDAEISELATLLAESEAKVAQHSFSSPEGAQEVLDILQSAQGTLTELQASRDKLRQVLGPLIALYQNPESPDDSLGRA